MGKVSAKTSITEKQAINDLESRGATLLRYGFPMCALMCLYEQRENDAKDKALEHRAIGNLCAKQERILRQQAIKAAMPKVICEQVKQLGNNEINEETASRIADILATMNRCYTMLEKPEMYHSPADHYRCFKAFDEERRKSCSYGINLCAQCIQEALAELPAKPSQQDIENEKTSLRFQSPEEWTPKFHCLALARQLMDSIQSENYTREYFATQMWQATCHVQQDKKLGAVVQLRRELSECAKKAWDLWEGDSVKQSASLSADLNVAFQKLEKCLFNIARTLKNNLQKKQGNTVVTGCAIIDKMLFNNREPLYLCADLAPSPQEAFDFIRQTAVCTANYLKLLTMGQKTNLETVWHPDFQNGMYPQKNDQQKPDLPLVDCIHAEQMKFIRISVAVSLRDQPDEVFTRLLETLGISVRQGDKNTWPTLRVPIGDGHQENQPPKGYWCWEMSFNILEKMDFYDYDWNLVLLPLKRLKEKTITKIKITKCYQQAGGEALGKMKFVPILRNNYEHSKYKAGCKSKLKRSCRELTQPVMLESADSGKMTFKSLLKENLGDLRTSRAMSYDWLPMKLGHRPMLGNSYVEHIVNSVVKLYECRLPARFIKQKLENLFAVGNLFASWKTDIQNFAGRNPHIFTPLPPNEFPETPFAKSGKYGEDGHWYALPAGKKHLCRECNAARLMAVLLAAFDYILSGEKECWTPEQIWKKAQAVEKFIKRKEKSISTAQAKDVEKYMVNCLTGRIVQEMRTIYLKYIPQPSSDPAADINETADKGADDE